MNSIIEAQQEYFNNGGGIESKWSNGALASFKFNTDPQSSMEQKLRSESDYIQNWPITRSSIRIMPKETKKSHKIAFDYGSYFITTEGVSIARGKRYMKEG